MYTYQKECEFVNSVNMNSCTRCKKKFKMDRHESCCLELCGELSVCRNCKSGTRSDEYKIWRKYYGKR